MKVRVKSNERWSFRFAMPTFLLFNRFTAFLASRGETEITYKQVWALFREIKRFRRKNGKWKLVEVQTSDGEEIEVII